MNFFVPAAENEEQAERVYKSFAKFIHAPIPEKRIWKLGWQHNGTYMHCEVGKPLPSYYQTGSEPVLAIFECSNVFKICTENRGGVRGEPVLVGKDYDTSPVYFEQNIIK